MEATTGELLDELVSVVEAAYRGSWIWTFVEAQVWGNKHNGTPGVSGANIGTGCLLTAGVAVNPVDEISVRLSCWLAEVGMTFRCSVSLEEGPVMPVEDRSVRERSGSKGG